MFYTVVVTPSAAGMPKDRDRVRLFKLYFAGLNRSKAYISMLETLGKLSLSVSAMKHGYGGNHGATGPVLPPGCTQGIVGWRCTYVENDR